MVVSPVGPPPKDNSVRDEGTTLALRTIWSFPLGNLPWLAHSKRRAVVSAADPFSAVRGFSAYR